MIQFRRVHGHIIPIKMSADTKNRIQGAGMIVGGAAVTAGIAYAGAKFGMRGKLVGAKAYAAATRTIEISNELPFNRMNKAFKAYKQSKTLLTIASHAAKVAPVAGAGIAGAGVYKLLKGKVSKQNQALASSGATAALYAIARKMTLKIAFPFIKG